MREYSKIDCSVWEREAFLQLNDDGKLLWFYLNTHSLSHSVGCYRILPYEMAEGLGWSVSKTQKILLKYGCVLKKTTERKALLGVNFNEKSSIWWYYDQVQGDYIYLPQHLSFNFTNTKKACESAERLVSRLPERLFFYQELAKDLLQVPAKFSADFLLKLHLVCEKPELFFLKLTNLAKKKKEEIKKN